MPPDGPSPSGSLPATSPPAPSLVGQTLDGRFRILKLIGEGGMGQVYEAEHLHIDRKFAIKLLKPEIVSNTEAVTRFRQEARASSSIGHRNIVKIDDFVVLGDGRIYMSMELLNGAPLNELIRNPITAERLFDITIQTGHGLAAAHAKGIVHRDMKPENIFVTVGPHGEDIPKILDFGIAKVAGNEGQNHLTRTGTIFGTPYYMAPEQALGNSVDARTDIYALGVILYECFSGSLPFQGESFMGILTQHITTPPEPVAQRAARAGRTLAPGLAEVIARAMQKDPADRFPTMDQLVNALVEVYRGTQGPGMSTYLEPFAAGSAASSPRMTPVPAPQVAHQDPDPSDSALIPPRRSRGWIAATALLAVGAVVAAAMMLGNTKPSSEAAGSVESGAATPVSGVDPWASPQPAVSGSGKKRAPDSAPQVVPAAVVTVILDVEPRVSYEVFEGATKLPDVFTDGIDVVPGKPRTIEIRAKGYKPKQVLVNGSKRRFAVRLDRITTSGSAGGRPTEGVRNWNDLPSTARPPVAAASGPKPAPPPTIDCSSHIVDAKSELCRRQYCAKHPDDDKHGCDTM